MRRTEAARCLCAESGLCARLPCDSPAEGLTTLPSATPALRLQRQLAAGGGPGAFNVAPSHAPRIRSGALSALTLSWPTGLH